MGRPSLQRSLSRLAVAVLVVAFVTAVGLIWATSQIRVLIDQQRDGFESVRAADQIEINLLQAQRSSVLYAATGAPEHAARRDQAWAEVDRWIDVADDHVAHQAEARLLADLVQQLREIRAAWTVGAAPLEETELLRIQAAVTAAVDLANDLSAMNLAQADDAYADALRIDRISNVVGMVLAIALVVTTIIGVVTLRRQLIRPIAEVRQGIVRFGEGELHARAPTSGPVEIREIAQTFNQTADALQRQREMQLAFVASIAHDLKNPLFALQLAMRLATRQQDEARAKATSELALRQVAQLVRMVEDLLDASRIEAGRLELRREPADLVALARDVVDLYAGVGAIVLEAPGAPVLAEVDPHRINQVLTNLVSNALKYSPEGGTVRVAVEPADGQAVIRVHDEGIGIPADDQRVIFEPFRRAASGRDVAHGVGLGLSVSKRIVEAHGGRIEVDSAPGLGSTFRVTLPTQAA